MESNVGQLKGKLKQVDVIFFDLDGTLIDTEKLYFRFWKEASKFCGRELTDEEALNLRSLESNTAMKMFKSIGLDYVITRNKRIELMNEYFLTHEIEIKSYAREFLELLKTQRKKLYIVTANEIEKAECILKEINFQHLIDGIITAKEVDKGKPFPNVFIYACEKVKKKPEDIIVFEDSPNGLIASYQAGCFTVMVEDMTPYTKDMDYVHASIASFKKLLS